MVPANCFDHQSGCWGRLGAEISIIRLLESFCCGSEVPKDGNRLIALVVGKVIVI